MDTQPQTKEFEIKGNIDATGNVSLTGLTYQGKDLTSTINGIDVNTPGIKLTEDQQTAIKTALTQNTQGGKSKKSYKKRKPKRNTRRTNRK